MRPHPRRALRPTLDGCLLEERVVLSSAPARSTLTALQQAVPVQVRPAPPTAGTLTARQLTANLQREFRATFTDFQRQVRTLLDRLDRETGGDLSREDLRSLRGQIQGFNNATAFRLLGLADVLPGGQRLGDLVQKLTVDNSFRNSIDSRVDRVLRDPRATADVASLRRALERELSQAIRGANFNLGQYLRTANFNRLSYDVRTGRPVPLQQFIGQNIARQYATGLALVAGGFPQFANNFLFSGQTDPDPDTIGTFNNVTNAAIGSLAFRVGNSLRLVPGASQALTPGLQDAFFGTASTSFANGLTGLTGTGTIYNQGGVSLLNSLYGTTLAPFNSFFGLPSVANPTLTTNPFVNPGLSIFNNYGNGFNFGYGTGTVGYGLGPNATLGTDPFAGGFYSGISGGLTGLGFTAPTNTFDPFGTFAFGSGTIGQPF